MDASSAALESAENTPETVVTELPARADARERVGSLIPVSGGRSSRRLVVISNRVVKPDAEHVGGLGQALKQALSEGNGVWMGWSGDVRESSFPHSSTAGGMEFVLTDLTRDEYRQYYRGFSNSVLWPLLHSRPDLMQYAERDLLGYLSVNLRFARQLKTLVREDDIVWVHDYHLLPLAQQARELGVSAPMGLFLHTSVPPPAILCALPGHASLLRTLAAYDLIGVQTAKDAAHLRDYFISEHGARVEGDGVRLESGRTFRIRAFPIGIDPAAVAELAAESGDGPPARLRSGAQVRVIGVDRLDYSKGIPERLQCIDRLLRQRPDLAQRLHFLQVAPTSRGDVNAYKRLAESVDELVEAVNARHGTGSWQPVTCLREPLPLRTLAGLYRDARVGLVTPLRDGMNLVAKEYIAAQDPLDPGVLVLSAFAGAASELDAAVLVNPYDIDGMSKAVARALSMPRAERRDRWHSMMTRLRRNDIHSWTRHFVEALKAARGSRRPSVQRQLGLR